MISLQELKSKSTNRIDMHLNKQKVLSLSQAAVLAGNFMLTHKNVFFPLDPSSRLQSTDAFSIQKSSAF